MCTVGYKNQSDLWDEEFPAILRYYLETVFEEYISKQNDKNSGRVYLR